MLDNTTTDDYGFWKNDGLKIFISYKSDYKVEVESLAEELKVIGASCFVAHDSIAPMSTWKNEILKALGSTDALVCYITPDFHKSPWTNQEIGYALGRGIPIYLYSVDDNSNPEGFLMDTQSIKKGLSALKSIIRNEFIFDLKRKSLVLASFTNKIHASFNDAKNNFYELSYFKYNDSEIEKIAEAFLRKSGRYNQLDVLLIDKIKPEHKDSPRAASLKTR